MPHTRPSHPIPFRGYILSPTSLQPVRGYFISILSGIFIRRQIEENNLQDVGSVYHNFDSGGFTAVVCLTESHLSIHTWPEHNYLTFDIFLSNYLKDNRALTYKMYESVKSHFDATVLFEQVIQR